MGRRIVAVIAGYLVMFVMVFVTFTLAYLAMGADGAFKTMSYKVTPLWIGVSFVLSLIAALAGGWVCAAIAGDAKAVTWLAVFVLVLGILLAIPVAMQSEEGLPKLRMGDVPNMEAMMQAQTPVWVAFLNPLLGAVGALLGGRLKGAA